MDYGYYPYQQQYNPYAQHRNQQPFNNVIKVNGDNGANAFVMPPNSVGMFLDANQDIFYYKVTDGAGFPTTRKFAFMEIFPDPQPAPPSVPQDDRYVSRAEFGVLQEDIHGLSEQLHDLVQSLGGTNNGE